MNGDNSFVDGIINANNVETMGCIGNRACLRSTINLQSDDMTFICEGEASCFNSMVTLTNVFSFDCSG